MRSFGHFFIVRIRWCKANALYSSDRGDWQSAPGGSLKKVAGMKCRAKYLYKRVCNAIDRNLALPLPGTAQLEVELTCLLEVSTNLEDLIKLENLSPH